MIRYARIFDGQVLDYRDWADPPPREDLAEGKPYFLPVETIRPEHDPVAEVMEGPTIEIGDTGVVERWTVRAKNDGEIAAMRVAKSAEIDREFQRLSGLPIAFTVGGVVRNWHADAEAVVNICGVVLLIAADFSVPNPRTWTPLGSLTAVEITHDELIGLGAAIAGRKDTLFTAKKAMQAEVEAMTDPADIAAVEFDGAI